MIEIFPTSRCVREFYGSFLDTNQLLPKAMSIAEFESKVLLVPNKSYADEDTRVLLMSEASKFANFQNLKIQREFLSFLKNSSYLFRFFEELALEKVTITELTRADTYAEFDEHLSILEELLENYTKLLEHNNLFDKITLPSNYEINRDYLMSVDGFRLHQEGFLNRFEVVLLKEVATITPLKILLHVNSYNQKIKEYFSEFDLEIGYEYELNLSTKQIVSKTAYQKQQQKIEVQGFSSRILQTGFINEQIAKFTALGIKPEKIAVILPDEKFATVLKEFDRYKNLNFAMGESFTNTLLYKKLDAIDKFIRIDDEIEHRYRLSRLKIDEQKINSFKQSWNKKLDAKEIVEFVSFVKEENEEGKINNEQSIFEEELFHFSALLEKLGTLELQKAFKLFLNRLSERTIDDVMGGKVTVMGLLESRGMAFDGVIVVDFTDEFVPKRSKKDMFLSSHVRELSGLPSKSDRENLQRYYYQRLFDKAKNIAISFVQNEQSMASRFLDELGFSSKKEVDERSYARYLFNATPLPKRFDAEILDGSYNLKSAPLSASKLKTLLTCKRAFYFKYVLKLKDAKLPTTDFQEVDIGILLHDALHNLFKTKMYSDENELLIDLRRELLRDTQNLQMQFALDIWLERLRELAQNEAKRANDGYKIFGLEKELKREYKGYILEGKIDRIDVLDKKLFIIDYKSGKIPQSTLKTLENEANFQLEFYSLLAQSLGEVAGVYYYDLKHGTLVAEEIFEEKMNFLDEILEKLPEEVRDFEKCESTKPCEYCPYVLLCGREK